MPKYTFKCFNGHEKIINMSYENVKGDKIIIITPCLVCGSKEYSRIYDLPVVKFSGKGFYITDKDK